MDIHSDVLTKQDLWAELPAGLYLEVSEHGSRSRARKFKVGIAANHGTDAHGIKRAFARNTGNYGGGGYDRAATWVEWGDWMVALFKRDPAARIGYYEGPASFVEQTADYAPHRPARSALSATGSSGPGKYFSIWNRLRKYHSGRGI